jgi:hypothetical protein
MVSVLTSDRVDRGFEARSGQTKHYAIGMCCFYAKHEALRRKINVVSCEPLFLISNTSYFLQDGFGKK